jgi:cell division protein FtsL
MVTKEFMYLFSFTSLSMILYNLYNECKKYFCKCKISCINKNIKHNATELTNTEVPNTVENPLYNKNKDITIQMISSK